MKLSNKKSRKIRKKRLRIAFGGDDNSLMEIHDEMKNELLSLPQLELLDKKLLEKYLQFFFSKNTSDQVRDICKKKGLNSKMMLTLVELTMGNEMDQVFPMPDDGNYLNLTPFNPQNSNLRAGEAIQVQSRQRSSKPAISHERERQTTAQGHCI